MGIASEDSFIFKPKPANNQAPVVVPILAPNIIPIPPAKSTKPADKKEIVRTDTNELDCISDVVSMPNPNDFQILSVDLRSNFSKNPPENFLNPSSNASIPNKNMATPAVMVLKSGLTQKPQAKSANIVGSKIFLSITIT